LQYPDQPNYEYLAIGMEPIMEFDPMLFTVFNNDGLTLGSDFGNPAYWYNEKVYFVFTC
jgi:hypothetical protein